MRIIPRNSPYSIQFPSDCTSYLAAEERSLTQRWVSLRQRNKRTYSQVQVAQKASEIFGNFWVVYIYNIFVICICCSCWYNFDVYTQFETYWIEYCKNIEYCRILTIARTELILYACATALSFPKPDTLGHPLKLCCAYWS